MTFIIIQVIISIVLASLILIQPNDPGMSRSITGTSYTHTRRGSEKMLFNLTIIIALLFVVFAVVNLFLS